MADLGQGGRGIVFDVAELVAFDDVADGKWYTKAIIWANQKGIVKGYGNGNFGPLDDVTREQTALMIMKYCEIKGLSVDDRASLDRFLDQSEVGSWAKDAVSWAVSQNLISGRDNGTLDPKNTATRAEASSMLMRLDKNILGK